MAWRSLDDAGFVLAVLKIGKLLVFHCDDRRLQRPAHVEKWIVPAEATREFGKIKFRHLIKNFAVVGEALEAVGESAGNVKLPAVFGGQFKTLPFSKRR